MAVSLTINGQTFNYPERGDKNWGPDATDWASAVTTGMLQKAGGSFTLLAEVDFGATYGLKSSYFKSRTSNVASAGQIRLARTDVISFRDQANASNLDLGVNSSDQLTFNGSLVLNSIGTIDSETKSANGAVIGSAGLVLQTADASYPGLISTSSQTMAGHKQFTDGVTAGDPGTEGSGIDISGVTFNSTFKVSDIDGTNYAQTILHRHSTVLEPLIVGARSNSDTSAHSNVTGGQGLFTVYAAGYAGSDYKLFGSITLAASSSGSISNTSAPGKIVLSVTENGATSPSPALTIEQDKSATFAGQVSIGSLSGVVKASAGVLSASSIVNADISASAAIALSKLAALTASKALVSDASGAIEASSVTNTELGYVSGVTSAIQTQLDAKVAKTLTTTTGDMIYASSANTPARLAIGSSGQVIKSVGGIPTWATFSGGINYLSSNPDAEADTTGWATYADAAGTSPVDGTGGSPNSTWTRTTSSPLRGSASFLFTHNSGASRQGEGVSYDFTIDTADKAKVLQIEFDYLVASGTFTAGSSSVDSDLTVWIYDVTNSTVIQPSSYKLLSNSSSIPDKFTANFQTASNSTSYRLIIHCGSTSTSDFTTQFDNFKVGPCNYVYGTPITDWVSYTPTFTGFGTPSSVSFKSRRVGDSLQVEGYFVTGTNTGTTAQITAGYGGANANVTIDTSKVPAGGVIGEAIYSGTATTYFATYPLAPSANQAYINLGIQNSTTSALTAANGNTFANSSTVTVKFEVPIVGWSSSVQMSDGFDARIVSARVYKNGTQTYSTLTKITSWSVDNDKIGMWDGTNHRFNILTPGDYQIYATTYSIAATTANQQLAYKVNGGTAMYFGNSPNTSGTTNSSLTGSDIIPNLKAGDYVEIYGWADASVTVQAGLGNTRVSLSRISGPTTISATDIIAASYGVGSGQTLTSAAIIKGDTKVVDTHGAYNTSTGVYTVPAAGLYRISHTFFSITATAGWNIQIRKNSVAVTSTDSIPQYNGGTSIVNNRSLNAPLTPYIGFFNAGDTIDFYNSGGIATGNLYANAASNYFTIERIK